MVHPLGAGELGLRLMTSKNASMVFVSQGNLLVETVCRDATKRGHIALETQDLSFCNTKTDGSN